MSLSTALYRVELLQNKYRVLWYAKTHKTRMENTDKNIGWGRESVQQTAVFSSIQENP